MTAAEAANDLREDGAKLADDLLEGADAAAEWTGLKRRSIYHMVRNKRIPHARNGTKLLFRKSELNRHFSSESVAA
jgi:excisionase family DNA binding protein